MPTRDTLPRARDRAARARAPARPSPEAPSRAGPKELNRYESIGLAAWRGALATLLLLAGHLSSACGPGAQTRVAERVLDDYRRKASVKPLGTAGSIRARLSQTSPAGGEKGSLEIEWEGARYRETTASAGVSSVRGIQAGKAFFIDEDGITRVGSEPMLAELVTRSYFWRRAYLFKDHERARLLLGPTDETTLSVRLRPRGGNELRLVFDRKTSALRRIVSPRFELSFDGPTRFQDHSRRPASGEITFAGLPTRRLPDPAVGGWRSRFGKPFVEAELRAAGGEISIPAVISGVATRLAIDADIDGPLRVTPELARRAGLSGRRDVFGRLLASGATLQIGELVMSPIHVEIGDTGAPEIEAASGGTLYRETIVEVDPSGRRMRIHDPDRFVAPDGFGRNLLDDDGNRPVAILFRSGRRLRLRAGGPGSAPLLLASALAETLGADRRAPTLPGLVWGTLRLPPLPVRLEGSRFDPDWGDHGALGWPFLLRFHLFFDMPRRWVYVKPAGGGAQDGQSER